MSARPVHLYAALLDVLAYRHHLEWDRNSGNLAFQEQLSTALSVFDEVNDAVYRVQAISDTIILTCLDHAHFPEFLEILRTVFVAFLEQRLFVRGGIAYSRHFQSGRLTYSHAIARAYELETTLAVYPRIVLDDNIIEMYKVGSNLPTIENRGLLCAENGVYFLNILTQENWEQVYDYAKRMYEASIEGLRSNESALAKYLRFERYLLSSPYASADASPFVHRISTA
jgi:hypothetical protein